jgi:hypothetical protein
MTRMTRIALPLAVLTTTLALAVPAQATLTRTFVSAAGSDSNPCTITQPCASFAHAYSLTAPSGIVAALDPGKYGPLTITGPVTINGNGWAAITAPTAGAGVTINAGSNDAVNLSGLTIDGSGIGAWGIIFNSGASLVIENCVARSLTSSGIALQPNAPARIAVSNTIVANNGVHGIYLQPSGSGTVSAVFNRVEAYSNGQEGIGIYGNSLSSGGIVEATAVDSVAGFNNDGFYALASSSVANTFVFVFRSTTIRNVRSAIRAEQFAIVHVSSSHMEAGGVWGQSSGGCVASYGDNIIDQAAPCGSVIGKN